MQKPLTLSDDASGGPIAVIIGACDQETIVRHLDDGARRVVVCAPVPEVATALASEFSQVDMVDVLDTLLGQEGGATRQVSVYNLSGVISTEAPTNALLTLFPGLHARSKYDVTLMAFSDLATRLGDENLPIKIEINLPGSEASLLQGLADTSIFERVVAVRIQCGIEPMFEGALDADAATAWLQEHWFERIAFDTSEDPDWPVLEFQRDLVGRDMAELSARAEAAEALSVEQRDLLTANTEAHAAAKAHAADLPAQIDDLKQQVADAEAVETQRIRDNTEWATKFEAISGELNAAESQLEKERTAVQSLTSECDALRSEILILRDGATKSDAKVSQYRDALAAAQKKAAALRENWVVLGPDPEVTSAKLKTVEAALKTALETCVRQDEIVVTKQSDLKMRQDEMAQSAAALAEKDAALTEKNATVDALEKELSDTRAEVTELREALIELRAERDSGRSMDRENRRAADAAAQKAQADLAVSLRMQMMAHADLEELQSRYQESEAERRQLTELVRKLTPHLQQAAERLRLMVNSDGPLVPTWGVLEPASATQSVADTQSATKTRSFRRTSSAGSSEATSK